VAIDTRRTPPRLFASADSSHWGPSVFHSDDLGAAWQEPDRAPVAFPADAGSALERVWQLQPSGDDPDVVWAGAEPASLFRSDDGGVTFEIVRPLWDHPHRPQWEPGFGGLCLHTIVPAPDNLLVAISAAGVYRSADGGETWTASNKGIAASFRPDGYPEFGQCVHKVAPDAAGPSRLYLQNHGGVYRSDDGGASWLEIGSGLPADFGFPIVAHPHRAGTAYVFPLQADEARLPPDARPRVFRTTDAGASWEALSDGLPDRYYNAVLRDAFCADDAEPVGLYLGTRNGEVWASADEGAHWSLLAGQLADVLSVRAATIP
jgi:hypothetical protein